MPFITFEHLTKRFDGVTALDDVSFSIDKGECHALMGENGAGKSTLGKALAGIHRPDGGRILIEGQPCVFRAPGDAMAQGIGIVHQELAFCPELSVAENLCLGTLPRRWGIGFDQRTLRQRARELLRQIDVELDVDRPINSLSTAQEQLVQIASAVGTGARVLVFDEPTSSLSEAEARHLFDLIDRLKKRGVTMIYVSHRMPEVMALSDRISILRDGKYVGTLTRAQADTDKVVSMMVGRAVRDYTPKHIQKDPGSPRLEVKNLILPGHCRDLSFTVHAGEIVGLAGLVGAGRSEASRAIFGLESHATGTVLLDGKPLQLGNVRGAMRAGLGLVPEDRKRQGLVLMLSCLANASMANYDALSRWSFMNGQLERRRASDLFARMAVKTSSLDAPVSSLSGGNQQKVVIAKWLARSLKVLIVDEPTRGVDVGAKAAIHELLDELARQGLAILMISSDLPEVASLSRRILVMREGKLVGELPRAQATQENLMRLMAGVETAAV